MTLEVCLCGQPATIWYVEMRCNLCQACFDQFFEGPKTPILVCGICGSPATCSGDHSGFRCDSHCGHGDCVGHECGDNGHCELLSEVQKEALKP